MTTAPDPIAVLGSGRIADAVTEFLAPRRRVVRRTAGEMAELTGISALAVVSDAWDFRLYQDVNRACQAAGVPWLPVRTELGTAILGPWTQPGRPGCFRCASTRRRRIQPYDQGRRALWARHGDHLATTPSPLLHGIAVSALAELTAGELTDPTAGAEPNVVHVDLTTLQVSRHRFLPVPECTQCGQLPADSATAAELAPVPRPKPEPHRFRLRDLRGARDDLLAKFVDAQYGLICAVETFGADTLPTAAAYLAGPEQEYAGFGNQTDYPSAVVTALAEALERYGSRPGARRTSVTATWRDVATQAVDPRTLGLYPDSWYDEPGFPYPRFTEDLPLDWVWGYSFQRGPVLLPESYVYYGLTKPKLAGEVSNGCALGSSLEEACLYGLLELLERDAFLMTWYARLPMPEVDLESAADRRVPLLAAAAEERTGYRIRAFSTTLEHGVPTWWVSALARESDVDQPAVLCSGGAHLDPETGLRNALHETVRSLDSARRRYPRLRYTAARMAADSSLVQALDDHPTTYFHPGTRDRFGFLHDQREPRPLTDFASRWAWPRHDDLSGDLTELVSRLAATGLDTILVDQTTADHRAAGLCCAKVVVPGLVPITFGHRQRRIHGLPRLLEVPRHFGRDVTADTLNPHPHPFP